MDDGPDDPARQGSVAEGPAATGGRRVDIEELPVFYETVGQGAPLVLLHGGLAANRSWAAQLAGLSAGRTVVAPERQAHGHTPDRPGPLTYQGMADETAAFLRRLELVPADLVGWSDGGMIGFLLAAQRPDLVRSLVMMGSGFSSDGYVVGLMERLTGYPADHPEMAMFAAMYAESSPDGPEHFPVVWEKVRRMWSEPFDWSDLLGRVGAPLLVIVGDDDCITVSHADELARRVRRGQLAVIPGASHLAPMEKPDLFNRLVLDFVEHPDVETWWPVRRTPEADGRREP
jgi:pimeloyl-ACP methyl ester carboxylesterase